VEDNQKLLWTTLGTALGSLVLSHCVIYIITKIRFSTTRKQVEKEQEGRLLEGEDGK
jgi:hypothetical protein